VRPVPREAKLVIYVGHDTNLANIGGMLELNWQLGRYQQNETPPAGAMVFELLRDAAGTHFVRVSYVSQTLDQMRQSTILRLPRLSREDRKTTPDLARIAIDQYCARTVDGACPFDEFYAKAKARRHLACVRPTPN
jgi:4-phytase / acid phosphatase